MGRSLSFFERLGNFCVRCNEVVKNIVHQLAALYDVCGVCCWCLRGIGAGPGWLWALAGLGSGRGKGWGVAQERG